MVHYLKENRFTQLENPFTNVTQHIKYTFLSTIQSDMNAANVSFLKKRYYIILHSLV